jgi:hypothetical protein
LIRFAFISAINASGTAIDGTLSPSIVTDGSMLMNAGVLHTATLVGDQLPSPRRSDNAKANREQHAIEAVAMGSAS